MSLLSISTLSALQHSLKKSQVQILLGCSFLLTTTSQAQAVDIKQDQINKCIQNTVAYKIADNQTANSLCTCTVEVRGNMTIAQMWEIESYAQSNKDPASLPYVIQMQQDLQNCTVGLTLNPPQQP